MLSLIAHLVLNINYSRTNWKLVHDGGGKEVKGQGNVLILSCFSVQFVRHFLQKAEICIHRFELFCVRICKLGHYYLEKQNWGSWSPFKIYVPGNIQRRGESSFQFPFSLTMTVSVISSQGYELVGGMHTYLDHL